MVLNDKSGSVRISEQTRQRVLGAAVSLGYVPNLSARQLRQDSETRLTLALIWPLDSRLSTVVDILRGVQRYIVSGEVPMKCDLLVETFRQGDIAEVKGLHYPNRFNGAILANLSTDDEAYLHEVPSKVPSVLFQRSSTYYRFVDADNVVAGRDVATHVMRNHHERLLVIVPQVSSDAMNRRLDGIMSELRRTQTAPVADVAYCNFSESGGYEVVSTTIRDGNRPSAIVCLTDPLAVGALSALHDLGIQVPTQCEVIGFDNLEISKFTVPKLSTVDIPVEEMAYESARLLVKQILEPGNKAESMTFPLTLVHRQTTLHEG